MGKKSRSRSGILIRDEHPVSFLRELRSNFWVKIVKLFDMDLDLGSGGGDGNIQIRINWVQLT
jgi:hypothetical protein